MLSTTQGGYVDPLVRALELGFALLPCAPGCEPEIEHTTAHRIAYVPHADPVSHDQSVTLAIDRGMALRAQIAAASAAHQTK